MSLSRQIKTVFIVISILAFIAYPFLVYYGIESGYVGLVLVFLVAVSLIRVVLYKGSASPLRYSVVFTMLTVVAIAILSSFFKRYDLLLYYPVAVNIIFFTIFFTSLFSTPIIERFALMVHKELDAKAKRYVYYVTVVWIVFFVLNGLTALYFALYDIKMWTLWCGFLSYIAMGVLGAVEYGIRKVVQKL
ncbi:Predicted membrane protein [Anaerobiospirillum thomasii]|uniref:COG4648 family protein n=1 Tax=Anaerobiospirillum thomasii TaxID=179995 RepID=UPI000D9053A6|nr:hypothetical protein [Anaerobiospirillum thomasii]SPT72308.1 Predicted membrane protein [Anaerobiospirillum thomasii]